MIMAREFGRSQRIADFLRKELSQLIQFELRDPRLGMVGVTDVEVSRDLSYAKVYVTVLNCDDKKAMEEPLKVLNGAAGFLRSKIAKSSAMRVTPSLRFYFDDSVLRGSHLTAVINDALKADAAFHVHDSESGSGQSSDAESED